MKVHPITGGDVSIENAVTVRSGGSTGNVGSFGMVRNGGTKMHKGVDFLCMTGDPVFSALDGIVTRIGEEVPATAIQSGRIGYGYRVYVAHSMVSGETKPTETRYAHLSGILAAVGDSVRAGQLLGWAGRSGNVDNDCPSHLHFEVRIGGNPTDPVQWLKP